MFESNTEKLSLKYDAKVPRDYDKSEMHYTFDFITQVFKKDKDIDDALEGVAREYDLSKDDLKQYMIDNKYILNKTNKIEFSKQLKKYNTKSLKKLLKKHGLKASGKRSRIEQRIFENNILTQNYHLSSKSRIFFKNKKRRMRIYDDYLYDYYYFNEFNDFYMDNFRKKEAKIPVEFIKMHIEKAVSDNDHEKYIFNNQVMADYYFIKENYYNMLRYSLRNYCMNLNPIWKINDLTNHVGVNIDSYDNLIFLYEKIGKNRLISAYSAVWDSFNFEKIIVAKYEGYRILKDILHLKDYDRINSELDEKFYSNDDLKIKTITQKTLFDF